MNERRERRSCRTCRRITIWVSSVALSNTPSMGVPDFPGDDVDTRGQTCTMNGPAEMVEVMKCSECGRSVAP